MRCSCRHMKKYIDCLFWFMSNVTERRTFCYKLCLKSSHFIIIMNYLFYRQLSINMLHVVEERALELIYIIIANYEHCVYMSFVK